MGFKNIWSPNLQSSSAVRCLSHCCLNASSNIFEICAKKLTVRGMAACNVKPSEQACKPSVDEYQRHLFVDPGGKAMDVFLMVRRKKLSIFTDCKDSTSVFELKKIIEGILKVPPGNQQLFNKDILLEDDKTLAEYGLLSLVAKAQCPATVGLAIRMDNGEFEPLEITPLSSPPELPYVMKETNGQEQAS